MTYKEEVLSLLEQELSYRGDYFIFSELSGWSANVRKERILDDKYFYEMSVIKLIEDFGPFRNRFYYRYFFPVDKKLHKTRATQ